MSATVNTPSATMPNLYVALALVVLATLLSAAGYGLYERGNAATARALSAETTVSRLTEDLRQSEEDRVAAEKRSQWADAQLVAKDQRLKALQVQEGNLRAEYDRLKSQLDAKDQECLARPLPDSLAARLRDPSADHHEDGATASPPSHVDPRPEVIAP